jgi:hypothetical protein
MPALHNMAKTVRRRFSVCRNSPSGLVVYIPEQPTPGQVVVEEQSPDSLLISPLGENETIAQPPTSAVEDSELEIRPFNTMQSLCAEFNLPYPPHHPGTHFEDCEVFPSSASFGIGEVIDCNDHEYPETAMRKVRRRASSAVSSSLRKLSGGASQIGRRASQVLRFGTGAPALAKSGQRAPLDLEEMRDGLRNAILSAEEDGGSGKRVENDKVEAYDC